MQRIRFQERGRSPFKVLCLGAHADDIEIGCGGSILRLIEAYGDTIEFQWVVFSATERRQKEARKSAALFLKDVRSKKVIIGNHRDGFFPYTGGAIKEFFEDLKTRCSPDLIFTHYREDRHQDHRVISDLTWNTFRRHLILEYEVPKYDGDLGSPNLFMELSKSVRRKKVSYIVRSFPSQHHRSWFTEETLESIMRIRGIESGGQGEFAEAFYCRKVLL
ncbi:MAG TPA: PIG-L deacetylase family protein [Bacteroidota bacterium]|nr:PIG-L deacetylase family protein [Bacteroidota bacterium]